jgi:hypothetical protein
VLGVQRALARPRLPLRLVRRHRVSCEPRRLVRPAQLGRDPRPIRTECAARMPKGGRLERRPAGVQRACVEAACLRHALTWISSRQPVDNWAMRKKTRPIRLPRLRDRPVLFAWADSAR